MLVVSDVRSKSEREFGSAEDQCERDLVDVGWIVNDLDTIEWVVVLDPDRFNVGVSSEVVDWVPEEEVGEVFPRVDSSNTVVR